MASKQPEKKSKYRAKKTAIDNIKFDSGREAKYYCELKLRVKSGEVLYFHRQVIFDLPGGVTYRVDFQEIYPDGRIVYVDVKGIHTPTYIIKKKQVEDIYNIEIIEM